MDSFFYVSGIIAWVAIGLFAALYITGIVDVEKEKR